MIIPAGGALFPARRVVGIAKAGRVPDLPCDGNLGPKRAFGRGQWSRLSEEGHQLDVYQRWVPLGDYVDYRC
ncbi:MAG: hypothetical protein AB1576_05865 [Bacillota bacterium]